MTNQLSTTTSNAVTGENILYVVLHGLISLVDTTTNGFTAFLLEIGEEHRYLFGNWLEEQEIAKRKNGKVLQAELRGVTAGNAQLDPSLNAIVTAGQLPNPKDPNVRAVFNLPRPRKIHYFELGTVQPMAIVQKDGSLLKIPGQLAGVRIFEYSFHSADAVFLKNQSDVLEKEDRLNLWQCPGVTPVKGNDIAVLHIYDQPGQALMNRAMDHTTEEFQKSAEFLGTKLSPTVPGKVTPVPVTALKKPSPQIDGLLPGEVECLSRRDQFVLQLLARTRSDKPILFAGVGGCDPAVCTAACAVLNR